jgi:ABC-type multidrug transport system fused ATPase/permease subunit
LISQITAAIIQSIQENKFNVVFESMQYFTGITVLFIVINIFSDSLEVKTLTKMSQWIRREFLNYVILSNNENFANPDTIKYNSPINRVSFGSHYVLNSLLNTVLPNITFVLVITAYFLYITPILGILFLVANAILFGYSSLTWEGLMKYKNDYEQSANENEAYVLDLFNNFDRIIFRGQAKKEMDYYKDKSDDCIKKAGDFYETMLLHSSIMSAFIYIIIIAALYYVVYLRKDKEIDTKLFITTFTILIMYRDRFTSLIGIIPNYLEFSGRIDFASEKMSDLILNLDEVNQIQYADPPPLEFNRIDFKNVYYKYKGSNRYIFENLNVSILPNNNIVGITGLSGRGKSTIIKLLLKMHPCEKGTIYIDSHNIKDIDPIYIRRNITYVHQSAKLFNKKIIDNMVYGCESEPHCKQYLDMIMQYPKIQKLYRNVDLVNGDSGSLGEGLSGGQRQVINIISGLVNPSPVLVLDEPTNALDLELKSELIGIIGDFKKYKKCIIIITHDRDVYPIFDERISL